MRRWSAVAALAALLCAGVARGQTPTAQQRKAAKAHFQQGRAYYEAGAWDDAVREYEQAYALVPLPDLLFNIGQAYRMKGDKPRSIAAYQRYLDRLPDGPLADEARNHVAALRLRIQVEEAEAARKKAAEEAAARRRLEAEAAARASSERADGARLRRVAAEEAELQLRAKGAAEARERQREDAGRTGRGQRIAGITLGSVGLAALALGAVAYQQANGQVKNLQQFNQGGTGSWSDSLGNDLSHARTSLNVAKGLFPAGAVLVATGVTLYVVGAVMRGRALERLRVGVAPTRGGTGFFLAGGF